MMKSLYHRIMTVLEYTAIAIVLGSWGLIFLAVMTHARLPR
jgi:hypothetical protein